MDNATALKLASQWETQAKGYDSQARRINRSKCFDGDRKLRTGLAEALRLCAGQLRAAIPAMPEPPPMPQLDVTNVHSTDVPEITHVDQTDAE